MPNLILQALASFAKDKTTTKADIEACCRIFLFGMDDGDFDDSEHPRNDEGEFTEGSGESSGGNESEKPKEESPDKPPTAETPTNLVYGTSHPIGGGESLLHKTGKRRKITKPTGDKAFVQASKQELAQLTSHAMQYMTSQQRKTSIVTMEMGGTSYLFERNEDYEILRVIDKW